MPRRTPGPAAPPPADPPADPPSFAARAWALVRRVPRGRVVSYGGIAAMLGSPRAARGVGSALAALPGDSGVPWWRVINRNGEISIKGDPGLAALQRSLLEREGVVFDGSHRVDWERFGWRGPRDGPETVAGGAPPGRAAPR